MKSDGRGAHTRAAGGGGDRAPAGIAVGIGAVAVVAAALLAALIPVGHTGWRAAVVAVTVGVVAGLSRDGWATAATVVLGWLVVNGFLVNRLGRLSWHGTPDLVRLVLLVLTGGAGLGLGRARHGFREWRARWRIGAQARALMVDNEEKERRDA